MDNTYPVEIALLLDPQTSGGLLAAMAEKDATALLATETDFVSIGRIVPWAGSVCIERALKAINVSEIQIAHPLSFFRLSPVACVRYRKITICLHHTAFL